MPKCKKCGTLLSKDDIFCPNCREKVEKGRAKKKNDDFWNIKNTQDYTGAYSKSDAEENRVYAILSYIPFVCFYPFFAISKKSPFVKFHANQGVVLFITEIILSALMWAINFGVSLLAIVRDILAFPLSITSSAVQLIMTAGIAYGIYLAATGKAKEMPVIGKIRILK